MADQNSNKGDAVEVHEDLKGASGNAEPMAVADPEMAEALRNYVPGTPEERKLVRKIDLYLMPMLWIMYILNYVDRTNIGNAKIAGMSRDLSLTDDGYAWVLSIFFILDAMSEASEENRALEQLAPKLRQGDFPNRAMASVSL